MLDREPVVRVVSKTVSGSCNNLFNALQTEAKKILLSPPHLNLQDEAFLFQSLTDTHANKLYRLIIVISSTLVKQI